MDRFALVREARYRSQLARNERAYAVIKAMMGRASMADLMEQPETQRGKFRFDQDDVSLAADINMNAQSAVEIKTDNRLGRRYLPQHGH